MIIRSLLKGGILLALLTGGFYYWYEARPRMVATRILEKFEAACIARDSVAVKKLADTGRNEILFWADSAFLYNTFAKFEPGFELLSANLGELTSGEEIISIEMVKSAKIDHEARPFYNIMLINRDGDWKVAQYYFPDLLDY